MWSDEARAAATEARKKGAHGHNAGKGNRAIAKHVKNQHKSVAAGVAAGAAVGGLTFGAVGAVVGGIAGGVVTASRNRRKAKR